MTIPTPAPPSHPTLIQSIRRHRRLVGGLAVGLMLLLGGLAYLTTPPATAEGRLGLTFPPQGNVLLPVPTGESSLKRYVAQRAAFATSDEVVAQIATETGLPPEEVRERLTVSPLEAGNGLLITATDATSEGARALVVAAMSTYRDLTLEEVTRRARTLAAGQRDAGFPGIAARTSADAAVFRDGVELSVTPSEQDTQTRGLPVREFLIGLLAGLGLGALLAWFIEDAHWRRTRPVPPSGLDP